MSNLELREHIKPALERMGAMRDHAYSGQETLKMAVRTRALATFMVEKMGVATDVAGTAEQLGRIAREDPYIAPLRAYVGGEYLDWWNNWEWSVPPEVE